MAKRPHSGGDDPPDGPDGHPPRPHSGDGDPESIREGEIRVAGKGEAGRPDAARNQPEHLVTQSTGPPGAVPKGRPAVAEPGDDKSTKLSAAMENSAANLLADRGWRIQQKPSKVEVADARQRTGDVGNPARNPDYLLEGRVFDCYSPTNPHKSVRGVWDEVVAKIKKGQTQRVVVNLEMWRGGEGALHTQFAEWPVPGLKEVKIITPGGDVVQVDLPPTAD